MRVFYIASEEATGREIPHGQRADRRWKRCKSISLHNTRHGIVAITLANLAVVYEKQKDFPKAIELNLRGLEIKRQQPELDNNDIAISCNNLGYLYFVMGENLRSESFYQEALALWENQFGPKHLNVGSACHNLARLYAQRGDRLKAETFYCRALDIYRSSLLPTHARLVELQQHYEIFRAEEQ